MANVSSMKRSQTNKYIIVCKTFLENKAENTVFLFEISNTERGLLSVKSIDLVDSHLLFVHFFGVLWSMHSQGLLGIFKIASLSYPSSVGFQNGSIPSVAQNGQV